MVQGKSTSERLFSAFNALIMTGLVILTLYPVWFSVITSLNDAKDLERGYVFLWPRVFTGASWRTVLSDPSIISALWITVSRTALVSVTSIFNTAMFSYAFSRPYLKGKPFYTAIGFISMYFSGGLIPSFMLINWLGLYDTYWVYILPFIFSGFYNVIIFNANYKAIPESLFECAKLEGAGEFRIFTTIVLPLSKPVIAAIGVFTAVNTWNDYGTTLFYTQSQSLQSLQYFILKIIKSSAAADQLMNTALLSSPEVAALFSASQGKGQVSARTVELAAMVLASLPMIVMYPFAQKFFIKGVMLGSVKG